MTMHRIVSLNSSSAVQLTPVGSHSGMDITIQNLSDTAYVYVGGEGVTTGDFGYRIIPLSSISFELPGRDSLYAVSSANSQIAILQTGLEIGE